MKAETEFYEYASRLAASSPDINHHWSEDRHDIFFAKKNEKGFDIAVAYDPASKTLELRTDRGYHDHFHTEKFESFTAALSCVFGLVRDLLSRNMRIEETRASGKPWRWRLQIKIKGKWVTESSTGMLFWNVFGRKSTVVYSNDVLPRRELDQEA